MLESMSENGRQLLEKALRLPEKERAQLASELLRSLEGDEEHELSADEWAAAWGPELERRVRAIEEGTATLHESDEVFAALRDKYPTR